MPEPASEAPAFRITETISDGGFRTRLVDGNSAEAEALDPKEFWAAIIGKSAIKILASSLSMNLQEFFGTEESPDELIVVSPLHSTKEERTPIQIMYASCMKSPFVMKGDERLFLPALPRSEHDFDTLIRVDQRYCSIPVPHHDDDSCNGFTLFKSVRTRLAKGFLLLADEINLTREQSDIMSTAVSKIQSPTE